MLQVNFIRQNPEWVKQRLAVRNFAKVDLVDTILNLDDQLRKLKTVTESIQATMNAASKEIGMLMGKGDKDSAEIKKHEVASLKTEMAEKTMELDQLEADFNKQLLMLPNLPNKSVPKGKSAEDNELVREGGKLPQLSAEAKPHWELIKDYNLIDFETFKSKIIK